MSSRGEQAASALEANLANLEQKLDAMLEAFESKGGETTRKEKIEMGADVPEK